MRYACGCEIHADITFGDAEDPYCPVHHCAPDRRQLDQAATKLARSFADMVGSDEVATRIMTALRHALAEEMGGDEVVKRLAPALEELDPRGIRAARQLTDYERWTQAQRCAE